jgi:hypothetical protein
MFTEVQMATEQMATEQMNDMGIKNLQEIPVQPSLYRFTTETYHILWFGIMIGTLVSYMSIMPLIFGCIFGFWMSRKEWFVLDEWLTQGSEMTLYICRRMQPWIENGRMYWRMYWYQKKNL